MKLTRTRAGVVLERDGRAIALPIGWDDVFRAADPLALVRGVAVDARPLETPLDDRERLAPVGAQEVWAAGVTYHRSRDARMLEAQAAGGADVYARVYAAPRPELFFKATAARVRGPGQPVRVRADSRWNVPEPELTLAVNAAGRVFGYTVGNDVSSRDIEGENPLYLPQAKVYDGACALGPVLLLADEPLSPATAIRLSIRRRGEVAFAGETTLASLKRSPDELVGYLFRELAFPDGCWLMTGTGIVPPDAFSLAPGDEVSITIDGVGTLSNPVCA